MGKIVRITRASSKNGEALFYLLIKGFERKNFETNLGRNERLGIWIKRFFPRLLHSMVLRSHVR